MDSRPARRRTTTTAAVLRMVQTEAPLGTLLRRLQPVDDWSTNAQTFESASVPQWQVGIQEKSAKQSPQHADASGKIEARPRRALTPISSRGNKPNYQPCIGVFPDMLKRLHEGRTPSKPSTPKAPSTPKPSHGCNNVRLASRSPSFTLLSGTALEPNARFRPYMEDVTVIIDPFIARDGEGGQWGYYAVYDGHGGRMAVDFTEANLHTIVSSELRLAKRGSSISDSRVAQALQRSFMQVDDYLKPIGAWKSGCTATVALVHKTPTSSRLHVANVGDSRAIVIDSNYQSCRISFDHRPTDVTEVLRVEAEGGFISRGRVNGHLAVSRALGDHWLKACGVTGCPCVSTRDVTNDVAMVVASDGLWDSLREIDVAHIVEQHIHEYSPEGIADVLVTEAQRSGSCDNISCVVCFLRGAMKCESK